MRHRPRRRRAPRVPPPPRDHLRARPPLPRPGPRAAVPTSAGGTPTSRNASGPNGSTTSPAVASSSRRAASRRCIAAVSPSARDQRGRERGGTLLSEPVGDDPFAGSVEVDDHQRAARSLAHRRPAAQRPEHPERGEVAGSGRGVPVRQRLPVGGRAILHLGQRQRRRRGAQEEPLHGRRVIHRGSDGARRSARERGPQHGAGDGGLDRVGHLGRVGEADLQLLRMDVHVDAGGLDLHEQDAHRLPPRRERRREPAVDREVERAVPDVTAVDEDVERRASWRG